MLRGDYALTSVDNGLPTARTIIAAANVRLFLGRGPPELEDGSINPSAIGILVEASKLGSVKYADDTFAVYAIGSASIIGLGDGIEIEGTLEVKINNTGRVVNESIRMDPADPESETVDVVFATSQRVEIFEGSVTLGVGRIGSDHIFKIDGTIRFTRNPIGQIMVDVPDAGGLMSAFSISGSAKFSFGGGAGFRLQDLRVNGFSIFGVGATISQPTTTLRAPTADLSLPYHLGVFDVQEVNDRGYIEVVYNDVNGLGLNEGTITDSSHEFALSVNGGAVSGVTINGVAEKVGDSNVYRYHFTGALPEGSYQLKFIAESWADAGGAVSVSETEQFTLATENGQGELPPAKPTVMVANPVNGASVDLKSLLTRGYIDVTFLVPTGYELVSAPTTFTMTGAGVGEAQIMAPTRVSGTTYRYKISDSNTTEGNEIDIFQNGEVTIEFAAGSWEISKSGEANIQSALSKSQFTVQSDASDSATASNDFTIGPLVLAGPSISLVDMGFDDMKLVLTVGLGLDLARLSFGGGQGDSGITAELTGILGTFDVEVDVMALIGGDILGAFNVPGKFGLKIAGLDFNIPNVVRVTAHGIEFNYDANYDPAENNGEAQKILEINDAKVRFEKFNIEGAIAPSVDTGMPGLTVWTDGFHLGEATLSYITPGLSILAA
jgi:hypothetical protein